jgi:type IV pilus assembly protein PilY1
MVDFGTGAVIPQTTSSAIQYAPGQQALYGIWDWKVGVAGTPGVSYDGLTGTSAPTTAITTSQLQVQTSTDTSAASSSSGQGTRTVSDTSICFVGMNCSTVGAGGTTTVAAGTDYGWYLNLPAYSGLPTTATGPGLNYQTEQVIYSPIEAEGAFIVNTVVPANNAPLSCTVQSAQGWTMGINPATGGALSTAFFANSGGGFITVNGVAASGIAVNATGSPSVVMANGNPYLISQTTTGAGTVNQINPPPPENGGRLTWIELH